MTSWEQLALALALGLLIGIERGWSERAMGEGTRFAGIRTFGLIGLFGGLAALASRQFEALILPAALLGFSLLVIASHIIQARNNDREYGITTEVATLITFLLGALAVLGDSTVAAALAVVTTTLLGLKPVLHAWLQKLEQRELFAGFKLLLISVVLLPVLPDRGFGPWGSLNPYRLWWLVVLIAGISFVGYFAIKIAGPRRGIAFTGLFGGLASSTAVTLDFSRLGRSNPPLHGLLAAGVVVAAVTMFPRMLFEISVVNRELLPLLAAPLLTTAAVGYGTVAWLWHHAREQQVNREVGLQNPFELSTALKFGALLTVIMLLSKLFQQWWGATGIYLLAGLSGISDVDAITLSLAGMAHHGLAPQVAARGIVLAAAVNTLVKGALVAGICGGRMARRVILALLLALSAGGLTLLALG